MKRFYGMMLVLITLCMAFSARAGEKGCWLGAFIADAPRAKDIQEVSARYGKRPYFVLVFVDWNNHVNDDVIKDIYSHGARAVVTWEPWRAVSKQGIDPDDILSRKHDDYIEAFAKNLKEVKGEVFMRFAHEMNGDWYPWSGERWGREKFIAVFRYVHAFFDRVGADNVRWIFAVNAEDVPPRNQFTLYYPGSEFVDYIGIDGYNWGNTKPWSRWRSLKEIMSPAYQKSVETFAEPVMITECGSTSSGGNKAAWTKDAMRDIKKMAQVRAVIFFDQNKETDWSFAPGSAAARELKKQLRDSYFIGSREGL